MFAKLSFNLLIIFFGLLTKVHSQTNYEKGYKAGFAKAFCYNQQIDCLPKSPVFVPYPRVQQNSKSYENGYDRGYAEGLEFNRPKIRNSNNDSTPVKFNPYISQIPMNGIDILATKQKLYDERSNWITNTIRQTEEFFLNVFIPVDPELSLTLIKRRDDWITENLNNRKPDFSNDVIFDRIQRYFSNYMKDLEQEFKRVKNECDLNTINHDRYKRNSIFRTIGTIKKYVNGKSKYVISEFKRADKESNLITQDSSVTPTNIYNFLVSKNGFETELIVLYFKSYDSYQYYFKDKVFSSSDLVKKYGLESLILTEEYFEASFTNPVLIRFSETKEIILYRGELVNAIRIGEVRYKLNIYDNGILEQSFYNKKPCWRDIKSGTKFYLNDYSPKKQIPYFSAQSLVTNNMK